MNEISEKIATIENCVESCQTKIDSFGKELGSLASDVRTVLDWILKRFGNDGGAPSLRDRAAGPPEGTQQDGQESDTEQSEHQPSPPESSISITLPTETVVRRDEVVVISDVRLKEERTENLEDSGIQLEISGTWIEVPGQEQVEEHGTQGQDTSASVDGQSEEDTPEGTRSPETSSRRSHSRSPQRARMNVSGARRGRPSRQSQCGTKERQPTQCDQCGKILKDAGSLRQHKTTHKDIRPYVCNDCGKAFRRKFHLKTHSLIHTGEKKHQCGYCGKLFLLPKDLVAHERIHTGERPYSCTYCSKSFNLKSHLTMHIRTHTGEKPYHCEICQKSFTQSNSLRVHKKVHLKQQQQQQSRISIVLEQPSAAANDQISSSAPNTLVSQQHDDEVPTSQSVSPVPNLPGPSSGKSIIVVISPPVKPKST